MTARKRPVASVPTEHQGCAVIRWADRQRVVRLPEPPSANRWWRRAGTHMHLSNEARAYKAMVREKLPNEPLTGPIRLGLTWWRGRRAGDLDKRLGVVLDALQGCLYESDAQIEVLEAMRFDGSPNYPHIEVSVESMHEAGQ